VTIPVTVPAVGHIETRKKGGIGIALVDQKAEGRYARQKAEGRRQKAEGRRPLRAADEIAEALRAAGFAVPTYADYRAMKWSKLLTNMIGNASSPILDMPPGAIYADPRLFRLEIAALRETLAVMAAWSIPVVSLPSLKSHWLPLALRLPLSLLQPILQRMVTSGRGGKMPSLHIDLAGGKGRSEVEYLNGAVMSWGQPKGIPTPVNQVLTDTLLGLTTGRLAWHDFRHQPDKLLTLVQR
jgi:2-dehydropantoate 2-reductase